jgi:hypothetical protein
LQRRTNRAIAAQRRASRAVVAEESDRSPSKGAAMAWKVTSWRNEALAAAEREARRIKRDAAREAADAEAYLSALERFGIDTRGEVRRRRLELRADGPGAATPTTVRPGRARLRDSPLTELFRATAAE